MFEKSNIKLPKSELVYNDENHTYKTTDGMLVPCVSDIIKPISNSVYGELNISQLAPAQEKGTMVHLAVELYDNVGVETIPEEYQNYFEAYKKFVEDNKHKYKLIENEYIIYCKGLNYCGTADKILEDIETGEIILVDCKTSLKIEYAPLQVQLAGYKFGLESLGVAIGKQKVLHLKSDKTYVFEDVEQHLNEFMACYKIYNYCKKYK